MTWLHEWLDGLFVQDTTAAHLILAMLLGAAIGLERQWRQRRAGLRTTVLVCIGSASFVDIAAAIAPGTTQVMAYVVSGVGFLGAGAIMREGVTVSGLNTAATVWCAAAVGAAAGVGDLNAALSTTAAVVFVNVMIRPVIVFLERRGHVPAATGTASAYHISIRCDESQVGPIRTMIVESTAAADLRLTGLRSDRQDSGEAEVGADLTGADGAAERALEMIVSELAIKPAVHRAAWKVGSTVLPDD